MTGPRGLHAMGDDRIRAELVAMLHVHVDRLAERKDDDGINRLLSFCTLQTDRNRGGWRRNCGSATSPNTGGAILCGRTTKRQEAHDAAPDHASDTSLREIGVAR